MSNPAHPDIPARPLVLNPGQGLGLQIGDSRITELAGAQETGGRAYIFIEESMPGAGPPLHRHSREDEYFFVLEGRYKWVMDGREHVGEPGAFVIAPAGSTHTFTNLGPGRGRMLLLTVPSARGVTSGLQSAFHAVNEACRRGPVSPQEFERLFGPAGLTFHGPPLSAAPGGRA